MSEKNKKIIKVIVNTVLSFLSVVLIYIFTFVSLISLSLVSRGVYDLYGDEIKDMIYDEFGDDLLDHKESNKRRAISSLNLGNNLFDPSYYDISISNNDDFNKLNDLYIDETLYVTSTTITLFAEYYGMDDLGSVGIDLYISLRSEYEEILMNKLLNLSYPLTISLTGSSDLYIYYLETGQGSANVNFNFDYALMDINDSETPIYFFDEHQIYYYLFSNANELFSFLNYFELSSTLSFDKTDLAHLQSYLKFNFSINELEYVYQQGFDNGHDVGYDEGYDEGYDIGYDDGLVAGNELLYDKGFTDGVNSAINPLVGFDDTFINYGYYTDLNEMYFVDNDVDLPINGNIYDLSYYVYDTVEVRNENGGYNENGNAFIIISNFTPFVDNLLEISSNGFNKIEYNYTDGTIGVSNISNVSNYSSIIIDNNKLVQEILLYFNANEDIYDYVLQLFTNNTYQNGYENGYNQGLTNGKNDVIKNPDNYDLYNQNQLDEAKDLSFDQGYEKGVLEGEGLGERGFLTMFNAILNAPYNILNGLLNFELFGVNLFNLITFIITTGLIIFLFALFKSRK